MAVRSNSRPFLLGTLLLCTACAPAFQRRDPYATVVPARIAALPALTSAEELAVGGDRKPLTQWSGAMAEALDPEIERLVVGKHGQVFDDEDATVPAVYPAFRRWTTVALPEIAAQMLGRADYGLHSVDKWGFGKDIRRVQERLAADFALVTFFRDTRRTAGHVVANALTGRHYYFLQVGVACLVDLAVGRMVWCNAKADSWPDLSVPANARKAVDDLLSDLYHPAPPRAPSVPPMPPRAQN